MKSAGKTTISLLLIIILLFVCVSTLTIGYVGVWLHTYNVLTSRELVATVELSQTKFDENGEYVDVTYTPIAQQSALVRVFAEAEENSEGQPQNFKIYGDTVHIGGPILKFHDHLTLLNFQTIYKVGKIYGRYNLDNTLQTNSNPSSYDLNGGIDSTWRNITEYIDSFPYNLFFETTQLSTPGVFTIPSRSSSYELYITRTGFVWTPM